VHEILANVAGEPMDFAIVPTPCPRTGSAYDFSRSAEQIAMSLAQVHDRVAVRGRAQESQRLRRL
jgi:hypothetical protein